MSKPQDDMEAAKRIMGALSLIAAGASSEITAISNKMRQGRSNASASGNQISDAGSSLMIWRGVVKTRVKAWMLSDTEAMILASAILGVAWLALM
jgi:hypothetical protein